MGLWLAGSLRIGRQVRSLASIATAGILLLSLSTGTIPGGGAAASQGDVKAQQAAIAFRQGRMQESLRLYEPALSDRSLGNERRASILTDRGVVYSRIR